MSWGERSCKTKECGIQTMENCNVDCVKYEWDRKTTPDSCTAGEVKKPNVCKLFGKSKRKKEARRLKKLKKKVEE